MPLLKNLALGLYAFAADLIAGSPLGAREPGRVRRFPERDARERALAALRRYVAAVPVSDPRREGQVLRLSEKDVFAEWADPEHEPALPAAGVVSAEADVSYEYLGGPLLLDDSYDAAGRTALALRGWHREDLTLEVWCRDVPERRAVATALKAALRPAEDRGSLDLLLPGEEGLTARFFLLGAWLPDEPESLRGGRRRILLRLRLRVADVERVDAGTLRPLAEVTVNPSCP